VIGVGVFREFPAGFGQRKARFEFEGKSCFDKGFRYISRVFPPKGSQEDDPALGAGLWDPFIFPP